jgi:micrococcal nuclease
LSALFVLALVPAASAENVRVVQVVDGDSLRLSDGREVRLIGFNAPEFGKDGAPDQPLAREARAQLAQLVEHQEVRLQLDAERHDRYRRTLAHVFLSDGRSAAEILLRRGLGFNIAYPPNLLRLEEYRTAEMDARREKRGVWNHTYYVARSAIQLTRDDTGFRLIEGQVRRLGKRRDMYYLDLSDRVSLAIPRRDWHYFGGDPQRFVGKHVVARGWISAHKNWLHLRLSHPSMVEIKERE